MTVRSRGLTRREATYQLRRDLIDRASFKRAISATAAGVVPAVEIARQLGDVFSATEIEYLITIPPYALEWAAEINGGDVRIWGPKAPVGHREPGPPVTEATVREVAAALEERLLSVLPREPVPKQRRGKPATIAAAGHKTTAAINKAIHRTLRAIGLDGVPRSGVRQARRSNDA